MNPGAPHFAVRQAAGPDLEAPVADVELRLADLSAALRDGDPQALESSARALQAALGAAVAQFRQAARQGGSVPLTIKHRLAQASAQVAMQRESLARATAALDRAIDVLMPSSPATYAQGTGMHRPSSRGSAIA